MKENSSLNKTDVSQPGSSGDESGGFEVVKVPEMKRQDSTSNHLYS